MLVVTSRTCYESAINFCPTNWVLAVCKDMKHGWTIFKCYDPEEIELLLLVDYEKGISVL